MIRWVIALGLAAGAIAISLPSPDTYKYALPTVPGAINPDVTQSNIDSTICVKGWTATIRPPVKYTDGIKKQLMVSKALAGSLRDYELDHELSLEDGGSPDSPDNLWMQPYKGIYGAKVKDVVETRIKTLICSRKITLQEGRTALMTDWIAAYRKYVGSIKGE